MNKKTSVPNIRIKIHSPFGHLLFCDIHSCEAGSYTLLITIPTLRGSIISIVGKKAVKNGLGRGRSRTVAEQD